MKARLILCDFAEEHNGKLYLMGGGWGRIQAGPPIQVALALILNLNREELDQPHKLAVSLVKESGDPALDAASQPIRIEGTFESGPKPSKDSGTVFNAPVAIKVPPLALGLGRYRWELRVDDDLRDVAEFDAMETV